QEAGQLQKRAPGSDSECASSSCLRGLHGGSRNRADAADSRASRCAYGAGPCDAMGRLYKRDPGMTSLRILVTNDDGVGAPGIDALTRALSALPGADVTVVVPDSTQDGA